MCLCARARARVSVFECVSTCVITGTGSWATCSQHIALKPARVRERGCAYVCVYVRVCVCVREREREEKTVCECVYVYICMCVRVGERKCVRVYVFEYSYARRDVFIRAT